MNRTVKQFLIGIVVLAIATLISFVVSRYSDIFGWIVFGAIVFFAAWLVGVIFLAAYEQWK